jgi:cytochrome c oxidase subunit 2
LPYPRFQDKADEVVTVVGIQWDWQMAHGITNKAPHEFLGKNEISLPVNKRIKFIVTSDDVNHDFGIYNNKGVLLTQTQAMPQYKNVLEYVFTHKGDYSILCLEYCGLAHGFMMGTIHVQ